MVRDLSEPGDRGRNDACRILFVQIPMCWKHLDCCSDLQQFSLIIPPSKIFSFFCPMDVFIHKFQELSRSFLGGLAEHGTAEDMLGGRAMKIEIWPNFEEV